MNSPADIPLLRVAELCKRFKFRQGLFSRAGPTLTAIDRVSLDIEAGQIYGLVGESGSGKSTLGRVIIQLLKADSGHVYFKGQDLRAADRQQLRRVRKNLQIIFQDSSAALSPRRSILQTLLEPLEQFGSSEQERHLSDCEAVLETVGLDRSILSRLPHQLSSGQKQRIGIARAVLAEPDLIIADEAVSALDVSVQAQILELVKKLQAEHGIAFLFISHDLAVISQVADVVGVMFNGQIVESAPVDLLFRQPSHPYTRELLAAVPDPDPSRPMSTAHPGAGLSRRPETRACVFADRCPSVMQQCRQTEPKNHSLDAGLRHHVKCYLYTDTQPSDEEGRQ